MLTDEQIDALAAGTDFSKLSVSPSVDLESGILSCGDHSMRIAATPDDPEFSWKCPSAGCRVGIKKDHKLSAYGAVPALVSERIPYK